MPPAPSPVRAHGVVYPSARRASEVLGVHVSVVYAALDRGREDSIGTRPGTGRPMPVTLPCGEWPSRAALARDLGVSKALITKWARKGKLAENVARRMGRNNAWRA